MKNGNSTIFLCNIIWAVALVTGGIVSILSQNISQVILGVLFLIAGVCLGVYSLLMKFVWKRDFTTSWEE